MGQPLASLREASPEQPDIASVETEQVVLGSLLICNDLLASCPVEPDWFFDPVHQRLMERIKIRVTDGNLASPVTMYAEMAGDAGLAQLGGPGYMARMAGVGYSQPKVFDHHVRELRNLWARRTLVASLRGGADQLARFELGDNPSATIHRIEAEIAQVASLASTRPLVKSWAKAATSAILQINEAYQGGGIAGTPTGIEALDQHLGGMGKGDMIVLAGRPSMGKTAIALGIAWSVAERGLPVFFASLEMPAEQLMVRWYSNRLKRKGMDVPYSRIRSGRISELEFRDLVTEARDCESIPMQFAERECRSLPRLRAAAKRAEQIAGASMGLIVVDYLQLIEDPAARSDYARVSEASAAMKSLAMDMQCPVIALSQLSRGVEAREPPIPRLSDLRDSGKIEEDADTILLAYREWYYLSKMLEEVGGNDLERHAKLVAMMDECKNDVSLFVPKMRGGETGRINLKYWPAYNMIGSPEPDPWSQSMLPYGDDG